MTEQLSIPFGEVAQLPAFTFLANPTSDVDDAHAVTVAETLAMLGISNGVDGVDDQDGAAASQAFEDITNKPTTLAGYGIEDAATSAQGEAADSALQPTDIIDAATESMPVESDNVTLIRAGAIKRLSWSSLRSAVRSWLTSLNNTWSKPQISSIGTVTYAATISIDGASVPIRNTLTLTGDVIDLSVAGLTEGQQIEVLIVQDATGSHTVTWNGVGGTEPPQNTDADGWTLYCVRRINGADTFCGGLSS